MHDFFNGPNEEERASNIANPPFTPMKTGTVVAPDIESEDEKENSI